ncbi:hypothetical protein R3W88_017062 [Solanum pinnatisectum]|uniref:Uncharacterized protein n=1 Tax=Solanum pinnatisectum TaxID=50273 RepID=A0AAV9KZK4_9SOLN|nr:hypothetical protein R3W88_017062 [Solanum pinnatisectum]
MLRQDTQDDKEMPEKDGVKEVVHKEETKVDSLRTCMSDNVEKIHKSKMMFDDTKLVEVDITSKSEDENTKSGKVSIHNEDKTPKRSSKEDQSLLDNCLGQVISLWGRTTKGIQNKLLKKDQT